MHPKHDMTAIIYDKRGRILSVGKNSYVKTHPMQAKFAKLANQDENRIFIHAEVSAIVKCKRIDKAHKIVIMRFMKDGTPANAAPCPTCQMAIESFGIKIIEHT